MKDLAYNQLNLLVRLKEVDLIDKDKWKRLLHAEKTEDCLEILQATKYERYTEAKDFVLNIDKYLAQDSLETFEWLYKEAPEKELIDIYTLRKTIHNLKIVTKSLYFKKDYRYLFQPDGKFDLAVIESAVQSENSSYLSKNLIDGIREVKQSLESVEKTNEIEIIYDRYFLVELLELAEKLRYSEVGRQVKILIDFKNISLTMRCLLQKRSKTFLESCIDAVGEVSLSMLKQYYEGELENFLSFLKKTSYGYFLQPYIDNLSAEEFLIRFDRLQDEYITKIYANAQTMAFGPLPVLSYLNDLALEHKNLKVLLTGKRSGLAEEEIKKRLRGNYE